MIPYVYHPEIHLGPIRIFTWGLIVAIGILISVFFALGDAKKKNLNRKLISDLIFYILLGGILGSRIFFVITNWHLFSDNLLSIFKVWQGGLSFFGGLLTGILFGLIFLKRKSMNFWKFADFIAPWVVLSHAFGRIACLIGDGGHVGKLTSMPWGVLVNNELRHLTALYDFLNLIILFPILLCLREKSFFKGFIFLFYLLWYCSVRFVLDFFRTDPSFYNLTIAQWFSIPIFLTALFLMFKKFQQNI